MGGQDEEHDDEPENEGDRGRAARFLLFVREAKSERAYSFLGQAHYVGHRGGRPMAITWRLAEPLPQSVYSMARVAAA